MYGFFSTFIHDPSHINSPDPENIKVVILNINDNKMVLFLILILYNQTVEYSNLLRDIVNEYNVKSIFYIWD